MCSVAVLALIFLGLFILALAIGIPIIICNNYPLSSGDEVCTYSFLCFLIAFFLFIMIICAPSFSDNDDSMFHRATCNVCDIHEVDCQCNRCEPHANDCRCNECLIVACKRVNHGDTCQCDKCIKCDSVLGG